MLLKETREIALRGKAQIAGDRADIGFLFSQLADSRFHPQGIGIEPRTDTRAIPEQIVEVRTGQPCLRRDGVEIYAIPHSFMHVMKGL